MPYAACQRKSAAALQTSYYTSEKMGYRYENNLDEDNERRWLASLSPARRFAYRLTKWAFISIGGVLALYAGGGWLIIKLI